MLRVEKAPAVGRHANRGTFKTEHSPSVRLDDVPRFQVNDTSTWRVFESGIQARQVSRMGLRVSELPLRVATRRGVVGFMERFVRHSAVSQGPSDRSQVALTFDDGPHPEWTPQILDALDRACAKATFFVVGRNVAEHPRLLVEICRRGHEIGTHLFSHSRESVWDDARFDDEVARSRDLLEPLLGQPLKWLRFPYGAPGRQRPRAIRQKFGLETVHWTFSSLDGRLRRPDDILRRVAAGLRAGSIVLMHDALSDEGEVPPPYIAERAGTVAALPGIARLLLQRRLSAVTLSELFRG